jgi:hypothetical protein
MRSSRSGITALQHRFGKPILGLITVGLLGYIWGHFKTMAHDDHKQTKDPRVDDSWVDDARLEDAVREDVQRYEPDLRELAET